MIALATGVFAAVLVVGAALQDRMRTDRLVDLYPNASASKKAQKRKLTVPVWSAWVAKNRRNEQIAREMPLIVDLFRVSVDSGMNVSMAMRAVAEHVDGPLAQEFERVGRDVARGRRVADALEDVVGRTSEAVRGLVVAVSFSERYGAPLSEVLGRLAHETRLDQERRAEQAAKRLSVHLLFPLAGCTLPAFALLTVAPLLAGSIGSLASSFS
jgi:tight adherence protein C